VVRFTPLPLYHVGKAVDWGSYGSKSGKNLSSLKRKQTPVSPSSRSQLSRYTGGDIFMYELISAQASPGVAV
jgi:hypothetical protein